MTQLFNPRLALTALPEILKGLPMSLALLVICFLLGNLFAGILMYLRQSHHRGLVILVNTYISFFRSVPALVVLFIAYFGFNLKALPAGISSLSLIAGAFLAEYYRTALLGIDPSQIEAAQALGMTRQMIFYRIIFPQAFRILLPALGNVLIDMFKSTSLVAMITVSEMFMQAKIVAGANQDYMTIYLVLAGIYWVVCSILSSGQHRLEVYFAKQHA